MYLRNSLTRCDESNHNDKKNKIESLLKENNDKYDSAKTEMDLA
jgi:hypothetical protein